MKPKDKKIKKKTVKKVVKKKTVKKVKKIVKTVEKKDKKLTDQEKIFCRKFVTHFNQSKAYVEAKYSKTGANANASRLIARDSIRNEIDRLLKRTTDKLDLTAERVLKEIEKLAFSNIKNLYDKDGKIIPVHKMPDNISVAIQEVVEDNIGKATVRRKYKLSDKKANLEMLGRYFNLFTDSLKVDVDLEAISAIFVAPETFDTVEDWEAYQAKRKEKNHNN